MGKSLPQIILFSAAAIALPTQAHGDKGRTHQHYTGYYQHQSHDVKHSVQLERDRLNREREHMHRDFDARMREIDLRGREIDRWQSSHRHNHQHIARRANEKREHLNRERDQLNRQRELMNRDFDRRMSELDRRQQYAQQSQHNGLGGQWRDKDVYLWVDGTCYQQSQSSRRQVLSRAPSNRCY